MAEHKCDLCNKSFGSEDALHMHNKSKHHSGSEAKGLSPQKRKIKGWAIFIMIVVLVAGGIFYIISNIKTLPPTTMEGHIEVNPPSHVLNEPMQIGVIKHMLEHSDGKGRPGIIINYNCEDFTCESDLIPKLEFFAEKYPSYVYVAPYPRMSAKIVLTKLGKQQILEEYDEIVIKAFIE